MQNGQLPYLQIVNCSKRTASDGSIVNLISFSMQNDPLKWHNTRPKGFGGVHVSWSSDTSPDPRAWALSHTHTGFGQANLFAIEYYRLKERPKI